MEEIKKLSFSEPLKFYRKAYEVQFKLNLKLAELIVGAKSAAQKSQLVNIEADLDEKKYSKKPGH